MSLRQEWGEKRPQITHVLREILPRRHWSKHELLGWLEEAQKRNEAAKQSHYRRRLVCKLYRLLMQHKPSL